MRESCLHAAVGPAAGLPGVVMVVEHKVLRPSILGHHSPAAAPCRRSPLQDLAWFLTEGLVPLASGTAVGEAARALCRQLAPHYRTLLDSFGIPDHLVAAPIAGDWAAYNEADNQGELLGQVW